MKVKNIMFSGVMAAILGATGANAAINVASQGYVDSKVGAVETNITNNYLSKTDAADTYLTEEQVTQQITNVVGTTDEGLLADVAENASAIATLETTKANAADVYTKGEANELLATKADLDDVYQKTETYTQSEVQAKITETLAGISGGTITLDGYATEQYVKDADATTLSSAKTYTNEEIAKLSAEGGAVKANADAIAALQTSVGTDSVADQIADAISGKANTADVYSKTDADTKFATNEALNAVKTTADAAATKAYVDTEFAKYTTTEGLTTTLSEYAKQADLTAEVTARETAVKAVDDKLAGYTKTSDLDAGFVSESEMTSFKTDNSAAIADAKKAGTDAQATADANAAAISELESDLTTKITMPEVCATTNCVLSTIGGTVQWVPLTEPLQ